METRLYFVHLCSRSPAQGSSWAITHNLGPKNWKAYLAHNIIYIFATCCGDQVILFLHLWHSHNPDKDFNKPGKKIFLFLIPHISSFLFVSECFQLIHASHLLKWIRDLSKVLSFKKTNKNKVKRIKNLLKWIPHFSRSTWTSWVCYLKS